jgi:histidyl-tRNA synthetase
VAVLGEQEIASQTVSLKNMQSGTQELMTITALVEKFSL